MFAGVSNRPGVFRESEELEGVVVVVVVVVDVLSFGLKPKRSFRISLLLSMVVAASWTGVSITLLTCC